MSINVEPTVKLKTFLPFCIGFQHQWRYEILIYEIVALKARVFPTLNKSCSLSKGGGDSLSCRYQSPFAPWIESGVHRAPLETVP